MLRHLARRAAGFAVQRLDQLSASQEASLARIVQAGLVKVNRPDAEVQAAMDEAALRELPKIEHRTAYLSLLEVPGLYEIKRSRQGDLDFG